MNCSSELPHQNKNTKKHNHRSKPQHTSIVMQEIGITNAEAIPTKLAAAYLSKIKNIPTAPSSLEVYRCKSRGPKYKKVMSRVFYTSTWLDEWANGIEIKIYNPSGN